MRFMVMVKATKDSEASLHSFGTKCRLPRFLMQGRLRGGQAHKQIEGELPCSRS